MKQQTGSALVVSLLILLVMTMLGVSAMSTAIMQEKMSGNDRKYKTAFINTESELVLAEKDILNKNWLDGLQSNFNNQDAGYYNADNPLDRSADNWIAGSDSCISIGDSACYTVENIAIQNPLTASSYNQPTIHAKQISRITVRGTDNGGTSNVMLQSYLSKTLQQ